MFDIGETISHNNCNYTVVDDFVSSVKNTNTNDDSFISGLIKINEIEHYFINTYKSTENLEHPPIGFWQTILNNHKFDYLRSFKCKFEIHGKLFLLSSAKEGLTIHNNIDLVDVDDFEPIQIDFDQFSHFVIVRTEAQSQAAKRQKVQKAILVSLVFQFLIVVAIFTYYQLKKSDFDIVNAQFKSLDSSITQTTDLINSTIANTVSNEIYYQQAHISNIVKILSHINIQSSEIDLTKAVATITIDIKDVDVVAKIVNLPLEIKKNYQKNTAQVTWQVPSKKP